MNLTRANAVVLEMAFGNMAHYDRFVRDVRQDSTITQNILRGRIAPEGARMQMELRGASRQIQDLVRRWKDVIVPPSNGPELAGLPPGRSARSGAEWRSSLRNKQLNEGAPLQGQAPREAI